jgi:hypothetical protein
MTRETLELLAATIGLIAALIPVIRDFFRWAAKKRLVQFVFSLGADTLAFICYILSGTGFVFGWLPIGTVLWLLLGFAVFSVVGFSLNSAPIKRFEIAIFVVQITAAVGLLIIGVVGASIAAKRPSPTPSAPAESGPAR